MTTLKLLKEFSVATAKKLPDTSMDKYKYLLSDTKGNHVVSEHHPSHASFKKEDLVSYNQYMARQARHKNMFGESKLHAAIGTAAVIGALSLVGHLLPGKPEHVEHKGDNVHVIAKAGTALKKIGSTKTHHIFSGPAGLKFAVKK